MRAHNCTMIKLDVKKEFIRLTTNADARCVSGIANLLVFTLLVLAANLSSRRR